MYYILTRFNWSKGRDKWTGERLELFEKYTLPSVAAQTNKKFKWLIFCDPTTDMKYQLRLLDLIDPHPNFSVHYAEPPHKHEWYNPTQEVLTEFIVPFLIKEERTITTRLDSDDMLACDFVDRVYSAIDPTLPHEVLIFPHGYIMDKEGNYYKKRWGDNPFVTAVETGQDIKTAFGANHMRASRISTNYKNVDANPAWVCVVHADNAKNTLERRGVAGNETVIPEWKT